jgi:hypothetical protein
MIRGLAVLLGGRMVGVLRREKGARHWQRLAEETGLQAEEVLGWVRGIIERVPDQLVAVCTAARAELAGEDRVVVDELEQRGTEHALSCLRRLGAGAG